MKRFIAAAATAAFLLAFSSTAQAVALYMTTNQGTLSAADAGPGNFEVNPGPTETDALGNGGILFLAAGTHTVNLWVDVEGTPITFLGLRINGNGGATIDNWNNSNTLGNLLPGDNLAIVLNNMTVSDTDFSSGCNNQGADFGFTGGGRGRCTVFGQANGAADQSGPMLMGTIDITMTTGSTIDVVTGPLSSYIVDGNEIFFDDQVLAAVAPEPAAIALLGMGLAGLAFVRRRS
jgi:hypothetical protein